MVAVERPTHDDDYDIPPYDNPFDAEWQGLGNGSPATPTQPPFRLEPLTAAELIALPEPPDTDLLLGPLVVKGARTIVVGDTGHGKTTFVLQMAAAIVTGQHMLDHKGAGAGPILILDLEQGLRSIKRSLREAGLADRQDVLYVTVPDGLALDSDPHHYQEVERIITEHNPVATVLDPYYKAHRGDANEERAIIDLMRSLDHLRSRHGFALILPAHPRKDIVGSKGSRKLTLHDVSGSGAVVRGAEVVIGIERLNHGYARLRYLKDRDGDMPVGDADALVFDKQRGFRLDPKEQQTEEEIEKRIIHMNDEWRTGAEWAAELGIRKTRAVEILNRMVAAAPPTVFYMVGPPGRSPKAQCYSTSPALWDQSGPVDQSEPESATGPTSPTYIDIRGSGNSETSSAEPGLVRPSDDDALPF